MGAGKHGGFGKTKGSQKSETNRFKPIYYEGTVKVNGIVQDVSRRVYQRNDIDFEYYDTRSGMTNLERMLEGSPPIGNDGKPIILHHVLQKESGPMVEVREVTHKEYHKPLHGLRGKGESFRNDPLLEKQYNNFRSAYWKWRAKEYQKGRKK